MPSTRRTFLKSTLIAGAASTLPRLASAEAPNDLTHEPPIEPGPLEPGVPGATAAGPFTRGVGVYPGAPEESFAPSFVIDTSSYRNLALHRPATASSSYDYNLTPQLVTDGIVHTTRPRWVSAWTSAEGIVPKPDREFLLDHWQANTVTIAGPDASAYIELGGGALDGSDLPEVDRIRVFVVVPDTVAPERISVTLTASDDAYNWRSLATLTHPALNTETERWPPELMSGHNLFYPTLPLARPTRARFYKLHLDLTDPLPEEHTPWQVGQIEFYAGTRRLELGGPYHFTSAWRGAGLDEEWVAVDLGAPCLFDHIALHWIAAAAEGFLQVSNDVERWRTLKPLAAGNDYRFAPAVRGRYVRVLMTRPSSPDGYILSELEVFGRGGPVPKAAPAATSEPDGRLRLSGGNWRLQRESEVKMTGAALSTLQFDDTAWLPATVPGTVLTSYVNAGAIPDPNFGQNQLYLSDSFFHADFWYRTTFAAPAAAAGQMRWLHFAGINWKAEVFLNEAPLGSIDGGFTRAQFDVTGKLHPGAENILAVRILKVQTPGSCKQKTFESPSPNGGALGADNPTFHASVGWDWIPTIRGRNTGIWGEVSLETSGAVTLANPLVSTELTKDNRTATVTLRLDLTNHAAQAIEGTLRGRFGPVPIEHPLTLDASATQHVTLAPFVMEDPKLWWPNGYGDAHLYDVELAFASTRDQISDRTNFRAGIRQITATEENHTLRLFINGRRLIAKGGNWGFAESMLRYRAREYDAAVRYHREMNFNMIRNWVGQVPDDAFYEACDRHGIVVWQDFWLANPWDGPIPDDNALFLANSRDTVARIRHHASIGLYCGRNEWFPPAALESGIRALLADLHPGIPYIGSSADDVVSGHGPYRALPLTTYFARTDSKLHSEIGMPNIPSIESVRQMMPAASIWPQGLDWGLHDFALGGAQGAVSFRSLVQESYGGAISGEEWVALAQFLNYEGYRAMFEAQSRDRMGVLLWMSHPCWPSFVWQTYDYYLEPTAAYFGCKQACEPLHIQWNRLTGFVEVVNYSAGAGTNLVAAAELLNLDGSSQWKKSVNITCAEDSVNPCIEVQYPRGLSPVHFLRLGLTQGPASLVSTNLYLRGTEEGNYRAIRALARVRLQSATTVKRQQDEWMLTTELHNPSAIPALMVRLKAVRALARDRILPALYSDNYVTLLPGERRTITTTLRHADTRNQKPEIVLSGFNLV